MYKRENYSHIIVLCFLYENNISINCKCFYRHLGGIFLLIFYERSLVVHDNIKNLSQNLTFLLSFICVRVDTLMCDTYEDEDKYNI